MLLTKCFYPRYAPMTLYALALAKSFKANNFTKSIKIFCKAETKKKCVS